MLLKGNIVCCFLVCLSNTWFLYYFSQIPTDFRVLGCHWSGVNRLILTSTSTICLKYRPTFYWQSLLTSFLTCIFAIKAQFLGPWRLCFFFKILNIEFAIVVMPYKHMKKNPTLPTTCFAFVCVPGKLVTLATLRFRGHSDSLGHHLPQEPPQGLGSWPCAFRFLSELMLRKLAQPIQTQSSFIQQLWD